MIKTQLISDLKQALNKEGIKDAIVHLEHPANVQFGDYSNNVALMYAKQLKQNPMVLAQRIIDSLGQNDYIEKTEVVKPGFINYWISKKFLLKALKKTVEQKTTPPSFHFGKAKKVMIEFAHPNTHKLFHIGHLRNITTGESIVRLLEAVGNKVIRANYQGDIGLHIAKCLYKVDKGKIKYLKTLTDKIKFLGDAYAKGQQAYETDEKAKNQIHEINRMIYEQDPKIKDIWKETVQWSLDYFSEKYKRVYSHFDRLYFESECFKRGVEICQDIQKKGILEKSEGAIVFKGKKYGLDTRVFINSLGFPTYEAKELALAEKEFSDFGELDKCIHVVTPEQTSFFKVTFKVEELIDEKKYKNKQYHLAYNWVQLKQGKMSSRLGNVIEGAWLIDETKKNIKEAYHCDNETAETLAIAAVKYSFLKTNIQNIIAFDLKESISLEGNSAAYLMYTYVRCQSVLNKIQITNQEASSFEKIILNKEEHFLLRTTLRYSEVVHNAAATLNPGVIATYLFELAQQYNFFYQQHSVMKAEEETKNLRLLITRTVADLIKNGLYLLGIQTVEKM